MARAPAMRRPPRPYWASRNPSPVSSTLFRLLRISGHPVFAAGGAFAGYRGTGKDVTAEVELANRLRDNEERFRQLSEVASDWFWEQDETLRFTYLSGELAEVLGTSTAGAIGKRREDFALTPDEPDWAAHQADLAARRPFRNFSGDRDWPRWRTIEH